MPDNHIGGAIQEDGLREFQQTALMIARATDAKTFVDVGANIGWYSVLIPRYHHQITGYAIEPHPETFGILKKNLDKNGIGKRIQLIEYAASDRADIISMYEHPSSLGGTQAWKRDGWAEIKAKCGRLDVLLPEKKFDIMKIEAQGFELKALRGLGGIQVREMFITYTPNMIRAAGDDPEEFSEIIDSRFSRVRRIHRHRGLIDFKWSDFTGDGESLTSICDLYCEAI